MPSCRRQGRKAASSSTSPRWRRSAPPTPSRVSPSPACSSPLSSRSAPATCAAPLLIRSAPRSSGRSPSVLPRRRSANFSPPRAAARSMSPGICGTTIIAAVMRCSSSSTTPPRYRISDRAGHLSRLAAMSPASANATERPTPLPIPITIRLIALLKAIGEARDGMLVLIACVYIFGFFSWAIYSLQANIGFIRIFDAQYFVAGILPAISIAFIVLGWTLWRILWPPLRLVAAILVYILFILIFLNGAIEFLPISVPHHPSWGTAFLIFAAGLFFIPLLLIGSREALRQKPLENFGWLGAVYNEILSYKYFVAGFGYFAIFLFLLLMFGLYVVIS